MSRTFRMLSLKVSTSKRKMLHMLLSCCPEPITANKLKFNRRTYTKEGSHLEIFYATFFTTAENAAKSHYTPINHMC